MNPSSFATNSVIAVNVETIGAKHRFGNELLALNQANVPEVGSLTANQLDDLLDGAALNLAVTDGGDAVALAVLYVDGADYQSPNYRWFAQRHQTFGYVDRIAVAASHRARGLGRELYRQIEDYCVGSGRPVLCAEVNTIPANPISLAFHRNIGFTEVGRCEPYGGGAEVAMLEKPLESPS